MKTRKATPELLAAAAVLRDQYPGLTPEALAAALATTTRPPPPAPPLTGETVTIPEFCRRTHICRKSFYNYLRAGKLRVIHLSKRAVRVPVSELSRLVEG